MDYVGAVGFVGIPEEGGVKRKLIAAIGIAGMMVSVAACGGDSGSGGSGKTGADAKELTVWLTVDAQNNWPELVKAPKFDQCFFNRRDATKHLPVWRVNTAMVAFRRDLGWPSGTQF